MTISIIVAIDREGGIGRDGNLLFRISADLRRFRQLTTGHTIIMGRKTFESFPNGALPNRRNMVITRNSSYEAPGAEVFHSLDDALARCDDDTVYIIGGGEIYRQALPLATRLDITLVDAVAPADTRFPVIDPDVWRAVEESESATDPASGVEYRFVTYLRNS